MKGVSYIADEHNEKKAIVLELLTLEENYVQIENLLYELMLEIRKKEEKTPIEKIIEKLKNAGKLK